MPNTRRLQAPHQYQQRTRPTTLHRVVARELDGFLADAASSGHGLPDFVEQTFRKFLTCGDRAQGFMHLRCSGYGLERAVAFSCKRRGICSSCSGRRMNDVATHLVENLIPPVPTRQWVLTLPYALRYRLAYDRELLTVVLDAFVKSIFVSHPRRAKERHDTKSRIQPGGVTFVQRFGESIKLNVHFHTLVLDGVYTVDTKAGTIEFLPLPAPSTNEVLGVLVDTAGRIARRLERRGLGSDRPRLTRICRYTARPAIATERLEELSDGRPAYTLRAPWHDGTTHVVFEPRELMAGLAAQIPPPRAHQVHYHGILAPAANWRDKVVPRATNAEHRGRASRVPAKHRTRWSLLLQKVFAVDTCACAVPRTVHAGMTTFVLPAVGSAAVSQKPRPAP